MTRLEVITEALRRIGVVAEDEPASASQEAATGRVLDSLFAQLQEPPHSMAFTWTLATVPDAAFLPLSWLLSVAVAAQNGVPAPEPWAAALMRLRAYHFPNDLPLHGDIDDDGTVTDAEAEAAKRAAYY